MADEKRKVVLIAEDDPHWLENAQELVRDAAPDAEVHLARTKDEALQIIGIHDHLDLVSTDMRMPNQGDGNAVVEAALGKGFRVITLSSTPGDLTEFFVERVAAVLNKGDDSTVMEEAYRKVLA